MDEAKEDPFEKQWKPYLTEHQLFVSRELRSLLRLSLRWFGYLITDLNYKVDHWRMRDAERFVQFRTASMCVQIQDYDDDGGHLPSILLFPQEAGKSPGAMNLNEWLSMAESIVPQEANVAKEYQAKFLQIYRRVNYPDGSQMYRPLDVVKKELKELVSESYTEAVDAELALYTTAVRLCLAERGQIATHTPIA